MTVLRNRCDFGIYCVNCRLRVNIMAANCKRSKQHVLKLTQHLAIKGERIQN
jgi:hypothetical protein